ncbi:MAG: hypothetical protein BWY63_00174 [Chloroflexi bacterium ADurb.Bin360]|nr:MAG: hypothetical protein BWY63_00174 [Chloroflexi bacterium ADurb.Bin360]
MSQYNDSNYGQSSGYAPRTSVAAVASLILGILGLIQILPIIGSIAGLILGYAAKNEISRGNGTISGDGLAQAGIILGWIGVGLMVIGLCLAALVFIGAISVPFGFAFCDQAGMGSQIFGLR